jgi:hypothetical protein
MTLTDPAGQPDLLQTVVATEHRRLFSLVTEASRPTDTPGVCTELQAQLIHELGAHLHVERDVIGPTVIELVGADEAGWLADEARSLVTVAERAILPVDGEVLSAALADHAERVDELLTRLHAAAGGPAMARLGLAYGHAAEAQLGN